MALSAAVGTFLLGVTDTIGTTYTVSGLSFQPKAVILFWGGNGSATDNAAVGNIERGYGFFTGTAARRSLCNYSEDALGTSSCHRGMADDACFLTISAAGSILAKLDVNSINSDGFQLILDQDGQFEDVRISYLALGGSDLTDTKTGSFTFKTTSGTQDYTDVAFQPDCLLLASIGLDVWNSSTTEAQLCFGVVSGTASAENAVLSNFSQGVQGTTDTYSYCRSGECTALVLDAAAVTGRSTLSAWLSNGFRLDFAEGVAATAGMYLALKGGRFKVGDLLTLTNTTTDIVESGLGVGTPVAVLFGSHCRAQSTADTGQAEDGWTVGAATSATSRVGHGTHDEDAVANTDCNVAIEYDEVYVNISDNGAGALEGLMDLKSMDSDGFTCIMDDADPAGAFVWYLAFGSNAATAEYLQSRIHMAVP